MDYSDQYNSELTPEQQIQFNNWASKQSRNIDKEKYDYDIQGWWKNNQNINLDQGHLTDIFKKPNHPTFSNESQYHGKNGNEGGVWEQLPNGSYTFTPGSTTLKLYKKEELQDYFKRVEPTNKLIYPNYQLIPVPFDPFQ